MKTGYYIAIAFSIVVVLAVLFLLFRNYTKKAAYEKATDDYEKGLITKDQLNEYYSSIGAGQTSCNPFLSNTLCGESRKPFSFGWGNIAGMF